MSCIETSQLSGPLIRVSRLLDKKYWISREARSSTMATISCPWLGMYQGPQDLPPPPAQFLIPVTTPTTEGPAKALGPGSPPCPIKTPTHPCTKNHQKSKPRHLPSTILGTWLRALEKLEPILPGQRTTQWGGSQVACTSPFPTVQKNRAGRRRVRERTALRWELRTGPQV